MSLSGLLSRFNGGYRPASRRRGRGGRCQVLQQLRMFVQESQEIRNRRQRRNLARFVTRKRVMAAAGQAPGFNLAQAELAADAADFLALPFAVAEDELVARRRIPP